jgi:predicted ABC-type ATPase
MRKPIVLAFAGPNGSGKTTLTRNLPAFGVYVNADDLQKEHGLTELEAAQQAEALRMRLVDKGADFSFETVLSTERNLLLLQKAKARGYEVQCIYVLTCDEKVNVARVKARHAAGGHGVPDDKVRTRYHRALALLPRLVEVCDKILIYDNSDIPTLVFSKEGERTEVFQSAHWPASALRKLFGG